MITTYPAGPQVPRTKLHRPRLPADLIDRPQILVTRYSGHELTRTAHRLQREGGRDAANGTS